MTEQIQETPVSKSRKEKEFDRVLTPEEVKQLPMGTKGQKGQRERYYDWLRHRDAQIVRGKFIFHEVPGGLLSFTFGPKWPGDKTERYDMVDGQIYSVPLAVAKHLNKEVKYPIHSYEMDENNKPKSSVKNWVRRTSFQSLEFVEIDDLTPTGTATKHPDA